MNDSALAVVIADDHPVFRNGLRALLTTSGFDVVGEASSGEDAVATVVELLPDVVVMDLQMPGLNGIQATRRIATEAPGVHVLVLTMFDDDESVFAAVRAGAGGYLLKDAEADDIVRSVEAIARGDTVFGPRIAARVRAFFLGRPPQGSTSPFPQLTDREGEILDLMAAGANNAAIARRLGISPKTVRNASSNIFLKLHVADRAEAIIRARDAGLGR